MGEFSLVDTERILAALPQEAARWLKSAQRAAFVELRDRDDFPGLACRFKQTSNERSRIGRQGAAISNKGPYGFAARGYALRYRVDQTKCGGDRYTQRNNGTPPFVFSGAMRSEVLKRLPKSTVNGNIVRTTFSLNTRALALFGAQRGITGQSFNRRPVTYQMTVYKDSVGRTGKYTRQVTRNIKTLVYQKSQRTYADEWQWRPEELAWIKRRAEELAIARVRSAVLTKSGRIRSSYIDRLEGVSP